jgi:ferredoxin
MTEPIENKSIPKGQFIPWLEKLNEFQLWAPVRRDKYAEFTRVKSVSDIDLSLRNTVIPPKGIIFQQTKNMLKYNLNKNPPVLETTTEDPVVTGKQIVIGVRPCDAHAFAALDPTFDAEFKDPYYSTARKNTILVGLACQEPDYNCFCTSVGYNPYDGKDLDILMIDIGDSYIFEIYTESGQKLINQSIDFFAATTDFQMDNRKKVCDESSAKISRNMDTTGKPEKLGELFESIYWDEISKKCLGCGICTYLCPTCYCFDITDEPWGREGSRVRTWDSCMYSEYTVHASGYNPRPARLNRLRNRVYHKFKYYPDLYNIFGCTGCGRCIRHCPVNIDIIDIVNGINELEPEGEK